MSHQVVTENVACEYKLAIQLYTLQCVRFLFEEKKWELLTHFGIGLAAGTLSSCANIPFDVAKSRIQGPQPVPGEIKYKTCFQTLRLVYVEEGFFALYKGLVPKILRLGPGGAIMFLIFENAYAFLQEKFA